MRDPGQPAPTRPDVVALDEQSGVRHGHRPGEHQGLRRRVQPVGVFKQGVCGGVPPLLHLSARDHVRVPALLMNNSSSPGRRNSSPGPSEEFVPAEDPERAGQCPKCAEAVRGRQGWRTSPHEREERRLCDQDLWLVIKGRRVVEFCILRDFHLGRHRSSSGATWLEGQEDYEPAITADEFGLR